MTLAAVVGCYRAPDLPAEAPADGDPPDVALGQRLFRDGRFSQLFATASGGDVNAKLETGDPVLAQTVTRTGALPGPYAGGGMACAACHLVDEQLDEVGGGMRSYADFARRSPIPARDDGRAVTLRNTPTMVGALLARDGATFLHFDAQFPSAEALVRGTLTGRNFGWMPGETDTALAQIARVIRDDDGAGELAAEYGSIPYRAALSGAAFIPARLRIPAALRVDVAHASDEELVAGVARLIGVYMASLTFSHDAGGDFDGSPYDRFLRKNGLPLHADAGEAPLAYARRLRAALDALAQPRLVGDEDGTFRFHAHPFRFGAEELRGLRVFLADGSCMSCHPPPAFTDFGFHNTGISQGEYDRVHGDGAFTQMPIPGLRERGSDTTKLAAFADIPDAAKPGHADLGLWNVFANPGVPEVQDALRATLCAQLGLGAGACTDEAVLPHTVAAFKTPGLRDLGHSAPYMHDGSFDSLEEAVDHYRQVAGLARAGQARAVDPLLAGLTLSADDTAAVAAFLRALDEDYN